MDRYVYINLIAGDNDKDVPAIIRFKAVDFGRDVDSKIFDKPCKPIRPLEKFVEKFLGISNNELEKYPSQAEVTQEFLSFIKGAHIICEDAEFCERALGAKFADIRTLDSVRRVNGMGYFDERYELVLQETKKGETTLADVQRITESAFGEACKILDDLLFHKLIVKKGKFYVAADSGQETQALQEDKQNEDRKSKSRDQRHNY